ncbi:MAG: vitamin B12-dependent ribonucleotide reductase [Acidimicrobiaceae bacterium]|nr:vitamin B12-dependent ribonucleotide reductase [Acidimicrobiaceae bacterium]
MTMAPEQTALISGSHPLPADLEDPADRIVWERRDARLLDHRDGSVAFEQLDVEVPATWSQNATNILAQKYFRGSLGTPERESSLRQVVDRVVGAITGWGDGDGYFADESEASSFRAELTHLLYTQRAAFNSPVWFNIGVSGVPQQASACFILSVDDTMESILEWYAEEGRIFKGGSGAGVNLSRIRASSEPLAGGGTASGPVSFMRGADASAGTIKSGGKTRRAAKMVVLDADHPDIADFIWCKAREERKSRALAAAGFDMGVDGADTTSVQYQNANNSVRVTDEFMDAAVDGRDWDLTARTDGTVLTRVPARSILRQMAEAAWECADPGVQFATTINRWHTAPATGPITASNPCSEYVHLDDSACNLASINLLGFLDDAGRFDVDGFRRAVQVVFSAQEILVGHADYPTEAIADTTRAFRQLGLGYANLGALLMAMGLPYDSDEGRAVAAAITALMTGEAYLTSTRLAERMGPFAGFHANREAMLRVLDQHRTATAAIEEELAPPEILEAAQLAWDEACERADRHGVRNSQATVLAPTGTIGLLMDCDTTGIEPDLGLVKSKRLVGGGTMEMVNTTVPRALRRLGYTDEQIEGVTDHIAEHHSAARAPLDPEHREVFACSLGDDAISTSGHIGMMAAVQPFLSGAISKTVNMPADASVDDVERLFIDSWRLGLKSVAIYRDCSKVSQPLTVGTAGGSSGSVGGSSGSAGSDRASPQGVAGSTVGPGGNGTDGSARPGAGTGVQAEAGGLAEPVRRRLPKSRRSCTFEFRVADCKGFVTVGEYPDGRPGEIFVKVSKQGSTLAGIMDAFAISVSHGLQYGVPLSAFVDAFVGVRFEPAGITDDPDIRIATSLMDYLFRKLAVMYLTQQERAALGVYTTGERTQPTLPGVEEQVAETAQGHDLPPDPPSVPPPGQLIGQLDFSAAAAPPEPAASARLEAERTGRGSPASRGALSEAAARAARERSEQEREFMGTLDAPFCMTCGVPMRRAGSCYVCADCGATSGCS